MMSTMETNMSRDNTLHTNEQKDNQMMYNITVKNNRSSNIAEVVQSITNHLGFVLSIIAMIHLIIAILALKSIKGEKRPLHKFILSMTVSELLFMLFYSIDFGRSLGSDGIQWKCIGSLLPTICYFFVSTANLSILCMVIDQYISICNPLRYNLIINGRLVQYLLVSVYVMSGMSSIIYFFSIEAIRQQNNLTICIRDNTRWLIWFDMNHVLGHFHMMLHFFVITIIICLYARICFISYRQIQNCRNRRNSQSSDAPIHARRSVNGRIKTAITVFCLFMTWIPYWILCAVFNSRKQFQTSWHVVGSVWNVLIVVSVICDPLIYSLRVKEIREAYWCILGKVKMYFCKKKLHTMTVLYQKTNSGLDDSD